MNGPSNQVLAGRTRESPSLNILSSGGDNNALDIGKHSPVDPKAGDVVADNLADQRRIVLIGRPFAAPFIYIPVHLLPAAPKRGDDASP